MKKMIEMTCNIVISAIVSPQLLVKNVMKPFSFVAAAAAEK